MVTKQARELFTGSDVEAEPHYWAKRARTAEQAEDGEHLLTPTDRDVSGPEDNESALEREVLDEEVEAHYEEENKDRIHESIKQRAADHGKITGVRDIHCRTLRLLT